MSKNRIHFVLAFLLLPFLFGVVSADTTPRNLPESHYVHFVEGSAETVTAAVEALGGHVPYTFPTINALTANLPTGALAVLSNNPNITFHEPVPTHEPFAQETPWNVTMLQAPDVWDTDRDGALDPNAPTGSGITVCIIDSGFRGTHEDFAGLTVTGESQILGEMWNEDGNGHGTHVAGTVNAQNNDLGVVGVAPGQADLYIILFDNSGEFVIGQSNLAAAAQACSDNGADIISMSLGGGSSTTERDLFQSLYDNENILNIAAAGNDGDNTESFPATYPSVVSVAALKESEQVADFSQHPPTANDPVAPPANIEWDTVELAAGGENVTSTWPYFLDYRATVNGIDYSGHPIDQTPEGNVSGLLVDGGLCTTGSGLGAGWDGKVVLCQRGDVAFSEKVNEVTLFGGVAAIIFNNEPGNFLGTCADNCVPTAVPSISLSQEDGEFLRDNMLNQVAQVVSSAVDADNGYNAISGTSMATPGVSGAAAVIWSGCGGPNGISNKDLRQLMRDTARDLSGTRNEDGAVYGTGYDAYTGFGLVQMAAALTTGELRHDACSPEAVLVDPAPVNTMTGASCGDVPTPRVAIAGDSWAHYMWDVDGAPNDHNHNLIFDMFGQADKVAIAKSVDSLSSYDAVPQPERDSLYAVGGTQARHWADTENWPLQDALNQAITENPTVDMVMFSIGGNDFLEVPARDSDTNSDPFLGGWYQNMDADNYPGFEQDYFDLVMNNAMQVVTNTRTVHPNVDFLMTSYDFANFNNEPVTNCELYSCPKRRELSYKDPVTGQPSPLVTDADINDLLIRVEQVRAGLVEPVPHVEFDNGLGLNHYYYGYDFSDYMHGGDAQVDPGVLPYPERVFPYAAGGDDQLPSMRPNFRPFPFPGTGLPSDLDPLHLTDHAYRYKIANQMENYFWERFRGEPTATFRSEGGSRDGWTDGSTFGVTEIRVGDGGEGVTVYGIVSFDTSAIPTNAGVEAASFYLLRDAGGEGENPFISGALGDLQVDIVSGHFGSSPDIEAGDATAVATATNVGCAHGTVRDEHWAIRVDITPEGLGEINRTGTTQFRISFTLTDAQVDQILFKGGDAERLAATGRETLEETNVVYDGQDHFLQSLIHEGLAVDQLFGTPQPILDVKYVDSPTSVGLEQVSTTDFAVMIQTAAIVVAAALLTAATFAFVYPKMYQFFVSKGFDLR